MMSRTQISLDPEMQRRARRIAESFPDQDFSVTDHTRFAVMQRLEIRRVATFDDDFSVVRYGPDCRRAFEVVR